jgi:hypothetical protein
LVVATINAIARLVRQQQLTVTTIIKLISLCHNNIRQRLETATYKDFYRYLCQTTPTVPRCHINYCVDTTNKVLCHHKIVLIKSGHLLGTIKLSNIKSGINK